MGPRLPASESLGLSLLTAYERAKDEYVFGGAMSSSTTPPPTTWLCGRASSTNWVVSTSDGAARTRFSSAASSAPIRRTPFRYVPAMHVRHLEINADAGLLSEVVGVLPQHGVAGGRPGTAAPIRERLAVWRFTVQRERYDAPRAAALLAALAGGAVCWELGGASARLVRKSR